MAAIQCNQSPVGCLVPIEKAAKRCNAIYWRCRCECGREVEVRQSALTTKAQLDCGCKAAKTKSKSPRRLRKRRPRVIYLSRHAWREPTWATGGKATPKRKARNAWYTMCRRCHREDDKNYPQYGARGVRVCDRWRHSFANFLTDLGLPPSPSHSLDRIDPAKGYDCGRCDDCVSRAAPANVRWAPWAVQATNKGSVRYIEHEGERLSVGEWSIRTGLAPETIRDRLKRGWPPRRALLAPADVRRRRKAARAMLPANYGLLSEFCWR